MQLRVEDAFGRRLNVLRLEGRHLVALDARPEGGPRHAMRGDLAIRVLEEHGLDDVRLVRCPGGYAEDPEAVGPGGARRHGLRSRPRARVTGRAGEFLQVDGRQSLVCRDRCSQAAAAHEQTVGLGASDVAPLARDTLGLGGGRALGRFAAGAGGAACDAMVDPVAVAGRAGHTRAGVHIRVRLLAWLAHDRGGVAVLALAIERMRRHIHEGTALPVERLQVVADVRRHGVFRIVEVGPLVDVPRRAQARSHAAHFAEPRGGRCRPAEILARNLLGPLRVIVQRRGVVASQAVDLQLAGNIPARRGVGGLVRGGARAAAGQMPAEHAHEVPGGQAERGRLPRPRPAAVREGHLRTGTCIDEHPRLARPARRGVRIEVVEVPAMADPLVVVAGAARGPRGHRQALPDLRNDLLPVLVAEENAVGGDRPAPVPLVETFGTCAGRQPLQEKPGRAQDDPARRFTHGSPPA